MFVFKEHGSAMDVAFLDASMSFDRVNRHKLEQRDVQKYSLRVSVMSSITNVYVFDGDLPTRTSFQWATVLSKVGSYPLYFLTFIWTICVYNCTNNLLVVVLVQRWLITTIYTYKMLANPCSCTLTLEMQIFLGK